MLRSGVIERSMRRLRIIVGLFGTLIAAVLALIVQSLPDIKRYLELREM